MNEDKKSETPSEYRINVHKGEVILIDNVTRSATPDEIDDYLTKESEELIRQLDEDEQDMSPMQR